ncbi:FUSC family protein [Metabacillus idriensis]|uniref:FUSC family protein n=1 Tax=Metabacillus idriensis TaxID=324768 RepID=UPI001749372A|nr:aromatic acid exporter family protein [Metabacillus idriensis]
MILGPRVLKTGLSVSLALFICSLFQLEPSVFAGVAAIFTIQPSIYRTWKQVMDQVQANTLGAALALFAIFFFGSNPIVIGVVVISVIIISLRLKMDATISLTLVTVLAIMSAPGNEDFLFVWNRFLIILIGIASAFLVNLLILPPKYKENYYAKVQSVFETMSLLMRTAISDELTEKYYQEKQKEFRSELQKLEDLYEIFDEEREKMAKVNPLNVRELVVFKQMLKTIQQAADVLKVIEEHYFQSRSTIVDDQLFDSQIEQLIKWHEYLLFKYEGKIKTNDRFEDDTFHRESRIFLIQMMESDSEKPENQRLTVVASAVYEYAFQLKRLDQLVDRFVKRADNEG